jgi:hypothetical protein
MEGVSGLRAVSQLPALLEREVTTPGHDFEIAFVFGEFMPLGSASSNAHAHPSIQRGIRQELTVQQNHILILYIVAIPNGLIFLNECARCVPPASALVDQQHLKAAIIVKLLQASNDETVSEIKESSPDKPITGTLKGLFNVK